MGTPSMNTRWSKKELQKRSGEEELQFKKKKVSKDFRVRQLVSWSVNQSLLSFTAVHYTVLRLEAHKNLQEQE